MKIAETKPITFGALKSDAQIFKELESGKYAWWERVKTNPNLYVEIRKDNEVHVYYEGGRVLRLRYCSKRKEVQAFTHNKYLTRDEKATGYENCAKQLDAQLDTIIENVHLYSRKHGIEDKEKWSEKFIQGNLIINHRSQYLDSEFAYNSGDIRIDLVECINGEIRFVELKRIDDERMVAENKKPKIIKQIGDYQKFIAKYTDDILKYYKKIYALKRALKLHVPDRPPYKVNPTPKLLIFDRWIRETPGRLTHRNRMIEIYESFGIHYEIINTIEEMRRTYYNEQVETQQTYYHDHLKTLAENKGNYKGKPREFVLKTKDCCCNLFPSLLSATNNVLNYFNDYKIVWWGENSRNKLPSGHLVSSQIHCLNHLFALRKDQKAVKAIMRQATNLDIKEILLSPLDKDGYITFEFVYHNKSLLRDKTGEFHELYETRGANCTSIDALVYAILTDGRKILIPIEWKYTETYNNSEASVKSWKRYPDLIWQGGSNFKDVYTLFAVDPYYELMRQTLLCEQIIRHKDCGIEAVDYSHIMVIPNAHAELKTAIENNYIPTIKDKSKFRIIDPQELLAPLEGNEKYSKLLEYLRKRYW